MGTVEDSTFISVAMTAVLPLSLSLSRDVDRDRERVLDLGRRPWYEALGGERCRGGL